MVAEKTVKGEPQICLLEEAGSCKHCELGVCSLCLLLITFVDFG